jgi:predicted ABC-type ATPase
VNEIIKYAHEIAKKAKILTYPETEKLLDAKSIGGGIDNKELVIFAGPNGSGKSTLAAQVDFLGEFINADRYEKQKFSDIENKETREFQATYLAGKKIDGSIKDGKPFAFETTFATNRMPSFMILARESGYKIILHFVALESPDLNVSRVAKRVSEGGHQVPQKAIIDRHQKSLAFLPNLFDFVDRAFVYDNSKNYRPFLVKENNQSAVLSTPPKWAERITESINTQTLK